MQRERQCDKPHNKSHHGNSGVLNAGLQIAVRSLSALHLLTRSGSRRLREIFLPRASSRAETSATAGEPTHKVCHRTQCRTAPSMRSTAVQYSSTAVQHLVCPVQQCSSAVQQCSSAAPSMPSTAVQYGISPNQPKGFNLSLPNL